MDLVSTYQSQIAEIAKRYPGTPMTTLHQHLSVAVFSQLLDGLNKHSAPGIDGESWEAYATQRSERLPLLLESFHKGTYRAPPVRRVYIPKGDGSDRPLGLPTVEDKLLQRAIVSLLEPVYELDFKEFSYGYRSGRSSHDALSSLFNHVSFGNIGHIIDADFSDYFGSIDHGLLREMLDCRVKDGKVRRVIGKWLKAGVLSEGQYQRGKKGTPQGGIISPLLGNIYLHYVLDVWFSEEIQPLLKGQSFIVRYADDFVLGFECREDAERVLSVLPKRFGKYKLKLNAEKTQLIDLNDKTPSQRSFDFLGFTHYMGKSRSGRPVLKRKTSKQRFRRSIVALNDWLRKQRHLPLRELITSLNAKLRGHYAYYGITFNSKGIQRYYYQTKRLLHKWLNRRGGKRKLAWAEVTRLLEWLNLLKPKLYNSYLLAKPV